MSKIDDFPKYQHDNLWEHDGFELKFSVLRNIFKHAGLNGSILLSPPATKKLFNKHFLKENI